MHMKSLKQGMHQEKEGFNLDPQETYIFLTLAMLVLSNAPQFQF